MEWVSDYDYFVHKHANRPACACTPQPPQSGGQISLPIPVVLFNEVDVVVGVETSSGHATTWRSSGVQCIRLYEFNGILPFVLARVVETNGGDAHHEEQTTEQEENNASDPNGLGNGW